MKDTTPIYFHSATYAHEHGELDQYHASHKANIACREAIEQAIADNYRDNRLGTACVQQVLQQFDPDRIFMSLPTRSGRKITTGAFHGTTRHGRRRSRSVRIRTVLDMTGMSALPWTAAIPDLPTCFSPRPGGSVRRPRSRNHPCVTA